MENIDYEKIENAIEAILQVIGVEEDSSDIILTPHRVANSLIELTSGYFQNANELINDAFYPVENKDMVLVKDINFASMCMHHLLPFIGKVHVAYLPRDKVIGLSKIPRIVNMFANRLQLQERMTFQIASLINEKLNPRGIAVMVEAVHLCALMRGIKDCSVNLSTKTFMGEFDANKDLKYEFMISCTGNKDSLSNLFLSKE